MSAVEKGKKTTRNNTKSQLTAEERAAMKERAVVYHSPVVERLDGLRRLHELKAKAPWFCRGSGAAGFISRAAGSHAARESVSVARE